MVSPDGGPRRQILRKTARVEVVDVRNARYES